MRRCDRALAEYRLDALHFSFCVTALCPFIKSYEKVIRAAYPELKLVFGTHAPKDRQEFRAGVKELLCQTIARPQEMNDMVRGTLRRPEDDHQ